MAGHPRTFAPLPGPWGFLTSEYALGLFAIAILLNRIQNIVVPLNPRHIFAHRFSHPATSRRSFFHSMYYHILPIDLSSTRTRLLFRIPSLYLTCKATLVWFIVLLQESDLFPTRGWGLGILGQWVAQKGTSDICWATFCAICCALCVGALMRGLEGSVTSANAAPFNMFGYSFLLHIYSTPITHTHHSEGMSPRPDKHVVVTIFLPLLQLTVMHILGIKQRWAYHRLVPTAVTSILALIHFHIVLWSSPLSYPLLNYMPCLFDSFLVLITVLTVTLNALTQILLEGAITRPLFGHATLLPKWDEDFSIALLRLGTASLEATSLAGLCNQVSAVSASAPVLSSSGKNGKDAGVEYEYGSMEINRFGVSSVSQMVERRTIGKSIRKRVKVRVRSGFANEIRNVKASSQDAEVWLDMVWYRELLALWRAFSRCARGVVRLIAIVGRLGPPPASSLSQEEPETQLADDEASGEVDDDSIYERFLQGEDVSDDDDEDNEYISISRADSDDASETEDDATSPEEETLGLYADLGSSMASASMILAHMTDDVGAPLTRGRYHRLMESTSGPQHGAGNGRSEETGMVSPHSCVVCTVETRVIICWPCRCLALCDDCRENLASRSAASKHRCPCCRRSVEGYSRIYIP